MWKGRGVAPVAGGNFIRGCASTPPPPVRLPPQIRKSVTRKQLRTTCFRAFFAPQPLRGRGGTHTVLGPNTPKPMLPHDGKPCRLQNVTQTRQSSHRRSSYLSRSRYRILYSLYTIAQKTGNLSQAFFLLGLRRDSYRTKTSKLRSSRESNLVIATPHARPTGPLHSPISLHTPPPHPPMLPKRFLRLRPPASLP